jgi:predicted RNase H-like HicB family nuclease
VPTYKLYLESGPKRRTTMVHVLDLLGCTANGRTTEEALAATPAAISTYRRFLRDHGEQVDDAERFTTRVAEHITEGEWLGNGSPYIVFAPDLKPITSREVDLFMRRFAAIHGELAAWSEGQTDPQLDAKPVDGRTARAVLLHVLGATGAYLSAALGGAPGFSRTTAMAERGEIGLGPALLQVVTLGEERVRGSTREERAAVRELSGGARTYTLRKAVRRMLEHGWEHLAELSRRPAGPRLAR